MKKKKGVEAPSLPTMKRRSKSDDKKDLEGASSQVGGRETAVKSFG